MLSKQVNVNWEDPILQRWLGSITRKSTFYSYKNSFKTYVEFTGLTSSEMIDEALEDLKKDQREKKDIVLRRLLDFYSWLKTDYPRKSRGVGPHTILGKGVSDKLAHSRVGAIRSFYGTFGVTVRMKGRQSLPRPRVRNKRMKVNAEQVKMLFNQTRTPRDRAIILMLFQGGMDVSTLCSIKYGDVSEALTRKDHPLKLELYRLKTGVEYFTFLGKDAVKALEAYISDMESRDVKFSFNTPLFLKERGKEQGITPNLVQNMMKTVAKNAGFIDEKNNGKAFNPLGPHALRESFGSIMINSGVPDTIVDFWLGHSIGEMNEAYKSVQFNSLKKMYLEREKLLSISGSSIDPVEIEEKISRQVQEKTGNLSELVNILSSKNVTLERKVELLEKKERETKDELTQLSFTVKSLVKELDKLTES